MTELEGGHYQVSGESLPLIQNHSGPRAQPTIIPLCGAKARAHRRWQVSIGILAGGSLVSASRFWVPDSISACRPSGSTMAPSSHISTVAHQSTRFAGLPQSLWLHLGQSSTICRLRTPLLWLRFIPLSLCLCQASPYLPLHHGIPDPRFGRWSQLLRLGSPDPPHLPGSSSLRLYYGLHHHLLRHRWSAPWSRQPFLHHGSSLRLHRGLPLWLLQVLHVLSLDPPSVSSTLDSVCHPPPGFPSSARTSSSFVCQPFAGPVTIPSPLLVSSS